VTHTIEEIRKALQLIHRVAIGESDRAYMSIPADPKRDADLILSAAIDELESLRAWKDQAKPGYLKAAQKVIDEAAAEVGAEIDRLVTDNAEMHAAHESMTLEVDAAESKIKKAIDIALRHGQTDGDHHKAWVIDQVLRALTGDSYPQVIRDACAGEDGPETYSWETGIAP
jgi:hypothetical protein